MRCASPRFSASKRHCIELLVLMCVMIFFVQGWLFKPLEIFGRDYPSATSDLNLPPLKQSLTDVASSYIRRHLKQSIEDSALQTDLSAEQLIARFLSDETPMSIRKVDALRLARLGSVDAKSALLKALVSGASELRAAVAEAIGRSQWSDAGDILRELLTEQDTVVLRGAISGLALLGDNAAIESLQMLLLAENTDEMIRTYIASKLGDVQTEVALNTLIAATAVSLTEETLLNVVTSLAKYPFEQTGEIFKDIFTKNQANIEFLTEATEALANSDKKALPFLLDIASRYSDAEVRASAAWAAGFNAHTGNLAEPLAQLVPQESDDEVRRRLYEALMRQDNIPSQQLLEQVITEHDVATKVAAANMLAMSLHQSGADAMVQQSFNQEIVPDLIATALGDYSTNLRYRAVFALIRAGTADANSALTIISQQAEPRIADLANRNLAKSVNAYKH